MTKENLSQLVQCYTWYIEIRCLKHFESIKSLINSTSYDVNNKNSIEIVFLVTVIAITYNL